MRIKDIIITESMAKSIINFLEDIIIDDLAPMSDGTLDYIHDYRARAAHIRSGLEITIMNIKGMANSYQKRIMELESKTGKRR
jgi:hypothetical protein